MRSFSYGSLGQGEVGVERKKPERGGYALNDGEQEGMVPVQNLQDICLVDRSVPVCSAKMMLADI